jgi:hypothetical protein
MPTIVRRFVSASVIAALAASASLVASASAPDDERVSYEMPEPRSSTSADAGPAAAPVVARTARLSFRPQGYPTTNMAARRLRSATVAQNLRRGRFSGTFVLWAAPRPATAATLRVFFGNLTGNNDCQAEIELATPTMGAMRRGFARSGARITLNRAADAARYGDYDCAFAALTAVGARSPIYDVRINELTNVYGKARLGISAVELLRAKVRTLRLVPGTWTKIDVTVRNTGAAGAAGIIVSGSGRGLVVGRTRLGALRPGDSSTVELGVKLTGRGSRNLRLTARSPRYGAARTVTAVPIAPPAPPAAGTYRGHNGRVRFSIRNGRVIGWRAFVMTTCGAYPDIPTTTFNWYDFPARTIPRNGIVDSRVRADLYTVELEVRVSGTRVTRGHFTYRGPNWCRGSISFDANRVGN